MPLLVDELSVWDISFRWAGYDPNKLMLRIPLSVRDNFRTLVHEIHHGHLDCMTLFMDKYRGNDPDEAKFYIRHWLDAIEECSDGKRYDSTLLKWAIIERQSLQEWCERHKVPLPEFWFPLGWGIEYAWPDDTPEEEQKQQPGESVKEKKIRLDDNHRWQMACQQIAIVLWSRNPSLTIKEVASSSEVQKLGGGENRDLETVQDWIKEFDPRDPSKKRGPKRKNNPGSGNSGQPQPPEK